MEYSKVLKYTDVSKLSFLTVPTALHEIVLPHLNPNQLTSVDKDEGKITISVHDLDNKKDFTVGYRFRTRGGVKREFFGPTWTRYMKSNRFKEGDEIVFSWDQGGNRLLLRGKRKNNKGDSTSAPNQNNKGDSASASNQITLGVCPDYLDGLKANPECKHSYCNAYWEGRIGTWLNFGLTCKFRESPVPYPGSAAGQDMKRTIAKSQSCPNCERPCKMNGPVTRMVCLWCAFEFCRLCRTSWLEHGFSCGKGKQKLSEEEDMPMRFCNSQTLQTQCVVHYMHHQEAINKLKQLRNGQLKEIADKEGLSEAEVSFIEVAYQQIADCELTLNWASTYYVPDCEKDRRHLNSYLIRLAHIALEQLYHATTLIDMAPFSVFRATVLLKTRVADNFFRNLHFVVYWAAQDLDSVREWTVHHLVQRGIARRGETGKSGEVCRQCHFDNVKSASVCAMCFCRV